MASCLLSLPNELTGEIIDAIPSLSDILSLALTCRALKNLLIPSVLNYRHISPTKTAVFWLDLARSPDLARNVRLLEVDSTLLEEPRGELFAAFCRALRGMSGLRKFDCAYGNGTVPSMGLGEVLEALRTSCPHLNDLSLGVYFENEMRDDWDVELPKFRNIETFYYSDRLSAPLIYAYPPFGNVLCFLFDNPSLVSIELHFGYNPRPLGESFANLRCPNLKKFAITHAVVLSSAFCSFLRLNKSLENLRIDWCECLHPPQPPQQTFQLHPRMPQRPRMLDSLQEGDLPNLRNCWVGDDDNWIYVCKAKPPLLRSLGRIRSYDFRRPSHSKRAFEAITAVSGSLKLLYGSLDHLKEDVIAAFPSLEVVSMQCYPSLPQVSGPV
ncbi:hypothetical protein JAAARDRAFT_206558 [Jaapia argillacea MUCL 33604]|uniref:F-box domain-containing protein n=1 Tax=Jaapia argillacea MUCL 33604 TaxID=933084 RepID=A0A067PVE2_9AGAM|nr:hypothetical protein JAAARDRAFT_206558 [Jaapia argillacea MUCL 33604]